MTAKFVMNQNCERKERQKIVFIIKRYNSRFVKLLDVVGSYPKQSSPLKP